MQIMLLGEVDVEDVKGALSKFFQVHYIRNNIYMEFAPDHQIFDGTVTARMTPIDKIPPFIYLDETEECDAQVCQVSYNDQEKEKAVLCLWHVRVHRLV